MPNQLSYDAVIVGSGPNGMAAAIRLAQEKLSVLVLEANQTIGGGTRSMELTLPGYIHDVCSAIHPLALASPFVRSLPLAKYGLKWIHPSLPVAHPLEGGNAAVLYRSIEETAENLGSDGKAYSALISTLMTNWESLVQEFLQPLIHLPKHPFHLAAFGLKALGSATGLSRKYFAGEAARSLFAGLAGHSLLPLESRASAAVGLVLGMAGHAVGWPLPQGGAGQIATALAAHLRALGGEIVTNLRVQNLSQLPLARAILLDVTPKQLLEIAGDKLPNSYRRRLEAYRYGPGVFKVDYALSAPIPWKAAACARAGTVHVGGTIAEIAASEREVSEGRPPQKPFVLVTQPSLFDNSRAPTGKHTAWAYCHVPNGSSLNMLAAIEAQVERFAPGFRDVVLARHTAACADLERGNPNLVGGDINGGAADLRQLVARPILSTNPYRTPVPGLYLCSSSTPPGGGVHGMCGFHAAEAALRQVFSRDVSFRKKL